MLLTVNVDADVNGFVLPAFVLCWAIAGAGLDGWRTLARTNAARALVTIVCLALPAMQFFANHRANDHHSRTYEARYMDALFQILPERSAILREAYSVDQLVLYKLIGERAARGRTVELITPDQPTVERYLSQGYTIYAFEERRAALESYGYVFSSVQLRESRPDGTLVPIDMALELSRLIRSAPCLPVGNTGWREITTIAESGPLLLRIDNYRPFLSEAVLYIATDDSGDQPPSIVSSDGTGTPAASVTTFLTADPSRLAALRQQLTSDGVPDSLAFPSHAVVHRLVYRVDDAGQFNRATLAVPRHSRAAALKVSVDLNNPQRATVCASPGT
jgi:hypothetical protein